MREKIGQGKSSAKDIILILLRVAASSVFLGRGILYLSKFSPLSALFWNQDWLEKPLLDWFGVDWEVYAATSESMIHGVEYGMGILFLSAAVACWMFQPGKKSQAMWVILFGTLGLIPYWLLSWADKDFQFPMFLEHFLQWGTPAFLMLYGWLGERKWYVLAWVFVSCTFVGHGQYAIGLGVPHSNDYVNMCIQIFKVDEQEALQFLRVVGWIDLALPVLFLLPYARVAALGYAALWGIATALARMVSHYTPAEDYYGLHPWTAETIVRLAHGLVPLVMLLILVRCRCQAESTRKC